MVWVSLFIGMLDPSWVTCFAIIADHVAAGVVAGGPDDDALTRLCYSILIGDDGGAARKAAARGADGDDAVGGVSSYESEAASDAASDKLGSDATSESARRAKGCEDAKGCDGEDARRRLGAGFAYLGLLGVLGQVAGNGLGLLLQSAFGLTVSVSAPGLLYVIPLAFAYVFMPVASVARSARDDDDGESRAAARRLLGAVGALCGALAQQLDSLRMVFDSARCFLLFASLFAIAVASNGSYKIMLYWGEDKFGWHGRMVTLMLASFAAATTLGCVLATRVLFARLGYATSAAALMVPSGVCLALLGLVRSDRAALVLACLVALGGGAVLGVTAELTPTVAPARQGQLQGTIGAVKSLAAVCSLFLFLWIFDATEPAYAPNTRAMDRDLAFGSCWFVAAGCALVAAACAAAAGDSDPRSHRLRAAAERGAAGADAPAGDEIAPATREPEFAFI